MKKILVYIMIAITVIGFSGCIGSGTKVKVPSYLGNEFVVLKNKNVYTFAGKKEVKTINEIKAEVFNAISFAKRYGKYNGYKYMAIVNKNINNLVGYPINNSNSFSKLIELYGKENKYNKFRFSDRGSEYLIYNNYVNLKVMYFKKSIPSLFLWKL